jgi:hypothetical protein
MNNYIKLFNIYGEVNKPDTEMNTESEINIITESFTETKLESNEERPDNLLIIGKAGIGKSTYITNNYNHTEYLMLSYTGIAASQINGHTLSSIFKLGRFNENDVFACMNKMRYFNKPIIERLQLIKGIIIDEFYTTPGLVMEKVDIICQKIRSCSEAFGGLQIILVGDDRQTECVDDKSFVDADLYTQLNCKQIMLPEHDRMRLTKNYMAFCNMFRNPKFNGDKMIRMLKDTRFASSEVPGYIVYYTNGEINKRNKREMDKFEGELIHNDYKKNCPIYITNSSGVLCNGMLGKLIDKKKRLLHIEVDGNIHIVRPSQIDFVPGFALSIHKSQAKTFPGINIYIRKYDLIHDRSKYIRLLYVALTRVRNFDKCHIKIY